MISIDLLRVYYLGYGGGCMVYFVQILFFQQVIFFKVVTEVIVLKCFGFLRNVDVWIKDDVLNSFGLEVGDAVLVLLLRFISKVIYRCY